MLSTAGRPGIQLRRGFVLKPGLRALRKNRAITQELSMQYFVTGATGFIGKRLVKKLLERKGAVVHFLIRKESADKVADLRSFWGVTAARAVPVFGDLTAKKLGVAGEDIKKLKGQIDHFYHLAAVYDLGADEETQVAVNIEGTRNTVDLAKAIDAGQFHHVSSIAAAGLYEGVFREDMFEEAEGLDHPYFQTKHESEKIVIDVFESTSFARGANAVPVALKLEVQSSGRMQIYSARAVFRARFRGLRWVMYNHRIISGLVFIGVFWRRQRRRLPRHSLDIGKFVVWPKVLIWVLQSRYT
ncbi:MAG: NAD-dependent epimerase/dehydratase family protein, partial [Alcaligenaceae bacterium]